MRRRFSEAEIRAILREVVAGSPVIDVCWNHCIPRSTFYAWKAKYGLGIDTLLGRQMQLEAENAGLRASLARARSELPQLHPETGSKAHLSDRTTASR